MAHLTFANPLPVVGRARWWLAPSRVVAWLAYARSAVPRRDAMPSSRFVSITLAALLVFLMRPVRIQRRRSRDVYVPILVDASRSMSIADADGDGADRSRARFVYPANSCRLGSQFHVDVLSFGDRLRETRPCLELAATDRQSDLSGALAAVRDRYRGRPVAGIIVISDGGDTSPALADGDIPPVLRYRCRARRTVGRDREVSSVTAAEAVADDSRIDLAVSAVSHGTGTEPIALQLLENGKPIEVRRIAPAAEGVPVHTVFQVTPARGSAVVYSVEVPLLAGELVPENNTRSVLVQPPSRGVTVLFVEGAPGFEHSFLKRAWAADPGLDVDSTVRKGKNEQGADTYYIQASQSRSSALSSGYPFRAEDLFVYDAIVLANVESTQLTREQQELTRLFVGQARRRAARSRREIVHQAGTGDTPLEEVLPLQLSTAR